MKGAVDPNFTFPLVWDVDAIGYLLLLFLLLLLFFIIFASSGSHIIE